MFVVIMTVCIGIVSSILAVSMTLLCGLEPRQEGLRVNVVRFCTLDNWHKCDILHTCVSMVINIGRPIG